MMQNDWQFVKSELQSRAADVCRALLPDGKIQGSRYIAHDPVQGDYNKKPALSVLLAGNVGAWQAFRGGAENEQHDLLGLIAYVQRTDSLGALNWAKSYLGITNMPPEMLARRRAIAQTEIDQRRQKEAEKERWKAARLAEIWAQAQTDISPALPYFAGRGIDLAEIPYFSAENFRFLSRFEHWESKRQMPCICASVRASNGNLTALHFTFLVHDCTAKAAVAKPKLMFGRVAGSIIELCKGADNIAFFEAGAPPAPVVLCEGIETGLSIAYAVPEARVWACTSITNIGNAPLILPCVGSVILARDNNIGNAAAAKQIEAVEEKIANSGKSYSIMNSFIGDDFNDMLTMEG